MRRSISVSEMRTVGVSMASDMTDSFIPAHGCTPAKCFQLISQRRDPTNSTSSRLSVPREKADCRPSWLRVWEQMAVRPSLVRSICSICAYVSARKGGDTAAKSAIVYQETGCFVMFWRSGAPCFSSMERSSCPSGNKLPGRRLVHLEAFGPPCCGELLPVALTDTRTPFLRQYLGDLLR